MQARIDSLERQLEQANERDRENRRIIAALTQRIPELPAGAPPATSSEPRESPEMADDEQQGRGPLTHDQGPQEGTELPWWRRVFGG
jgi:hypothetical protein